MTLVWNFFATAYLVTAITCIAVAWLCWRRSSIPAGLSLTLLMLAIGEWAFAGTFEIAAVGIPTKVFWGQLSYIGNATSPVLLLVFAIDYARHTQYLTRRNLLLLFAFPFLTILIAWTNNFHHWLWSSYTLDPAGSNIVIYGHDGFWFWIFVAYSYLAIAAGMIVLARAAIGFRGIYRHQSTLLLLSTILPSAWNVIYVLGLSPVRGLDLTPLAFAITGWLLVITIFRFHLLDLVPIARDLLIENMTDGVLVLDVRQRVVDVNPAARRMLDEFGIKIGQRLEPIRQALARHETEFALGEHPPRYFELNTISLDDPHRHHTGHLIILHDITDSKNMQVKLQEMNTNLEQLVAGRTIELQMTIKELQDALAERDRVTQVLREMENALAQRVADQSRKLSALYELILFAGQSLSVEQIQQQALEIIMTVMTSDMGCIHHWDEKSQSLRLIAQRGLTKEMQAQLKTLPANWLLSDRIPHAVPNLNESNDVPEQIRLTAVPSYIGVPTYLLGRPIGSLGLYWKEPHSFPVEDIALFSAMADQLGIIIENARLRYRGEAAAALQERRRLARDLHDSVTQSLHSLVLVADTATHRLKQGKWDRLETSLAQLSDSARQALKEMRLLLYELRLANPDQLNLVDAIRLRLDTVEKRAGVEVQFAAKYPVHVRKAWENELYFITMEALNNSLKYSRATLVNVRLETCADRIELEISDNGKGIDPQTTRPGGQGLTNMTERAERLGGVLNIDSRPGAGTRIYFKREGM
ncbi:MAG: GAF domain-containing protein [Chloroflexi bacterium]|nr:GAF domain-containing protein [Chloroflexota bacterium]